MVWYVYGTFNCKLQLRFHNKIALMLIRITLQLLQSIFMLGATRMWLNLCFQQGIKGRLMFGKYF